MRGEVVKSWSSGNSYLRLVSSLYQEQSKVMTLSMHTVSELQQALEAIQHLEKLTCAGEAKLKCRTEIKLSLVDSKEMCS